MSVADLPLLRLFDEATSTCTYIVHDPVSREAAIIDPVLEQVERDLGVLRAHGLVLRWSIETHAHADHVTGTGHLAQALGATSAAPLHCGIAAAAHQVGDGDVLRFGAESLRALHTPGHTEGSTCYHWSHAGSDVVFTGDTLLIEGCGRTDFQSGSAEALYDSIHARLFTLPDATMVFPGHDYAGRISSTIGHEKQHNRRLAGRSRPDFVALMAALDLPPPRHIDRALAGNRTLGIAPGTSNEPSSSS